VERSSVINPLLNRHIACKCRQDVDGDASDVRIFDFVLTGDDLRTITELSPPDGPLVSLQGLAPDWNS